MRTANDALRNQTLNRSLRQEGMEELRQVWQQALGDKRSGIPVSDVFDRLEQKYQSLDELNR
jgi:antitoxin ParD1/3/4